jgi:hypothetical protein
MMGFSLFIQPIAAMMIFNFKDGKRRSAFLFIGFSARVVRLPNRPGLCFAHKQKPANRLF